MLQAQCEFGIKYTEVFQPIVSVLHSLHHLNGTQLTSGHADCSLSVSNRPGTCDSLHVTNISLDVVSITAILHPKF